MLDAIYYEGRPWGAFRQFTLNQNSTVKILSLNPKSILSLQYHNHRSEFWRVIKGSGFVIRDGEEIAVTEGDEFFIPQGMSHRLKTEDDSLEVLEISFGEFDENDIIRLEDNYGLK